MGGQRYVSPLTPLSSSPDAFFSNQDFFLAIHGDKQQTERDWVLDQFKTGKSPIMVATDVASRGIG
jgi:RecG-like helicase